MSSRNLFSSSAYGDWIGRPSLCNDGSKWICVYRVANQHNDGVEARICIRFSEDEGATWTSENVFTDDNPVTGAPFYNVAQSDASLPCVLKAPNGDLLLTASIGGIGASLWRSTDGGASWSDEGAISPAYDELNEMIVVGSDIYAVCYAGGYNCDLIKSTDSGATWALVSHVTEDADGFDVNEYSVCNPSGNNLLVAMRRYSRGYFLQRKSTDLGATWGDFSIPSNVGTIHRPRLMVDGSRIWLLGRNFYIDGKEKTLICYTDDVGDTWGGALELEGDYQVDCGYAAILKKTDGNVYVLSYLGTFSAATIYEYIVGNIA